MHEKVLKNVSKVSKNLKSCSAKKRKEVHCRCTVGGQEVQRRVKMVKRVKGGKQGEEERVTETQSKNTHIHFSEKIHITRKKKMYTKTFFQKIKTTNFFLKKKNL